MPAASMTTHPITGAVCRFDEAAHIYETERAGILTPVSALVANYFPAFDAPAHAARVAKVRGVTPDAILAEWEAKRNTAARLGTRVHEVAEDILAGSPPRHIPESDREQAMMRSVWDYIAVLRDQGWAFLATELVVFSESWHLAGTIDLLARTPAGKLCILDWKTNQELHDESRYGVKGLGPCAALDDSSLVRYSLQLSTYAAIARHEGYTAEDIAIGVLHVTETGVCPMPVPDRRNVVTEMILDTIVTGWNLPF